MKLFLAPLNHDATLFGAFTLLRERPLVLVITERRVLDGWDEMTAACTILGVQAARIGLRDDVLTEEKIERRLRQYFGWTPGDDVYAPAIQGCHPHHIMIHRAAKRVFNRVISYCCYASSSVHYAEIGARAIVGTSREQQLKRLALAQHSSQLKQTEGEPEWLVP